jgi:hypothetical protein
VSVMSGNSRKSQQFRITYYEWYFSLYKYKTTTQPNEVLWWVFWKVYLARQRLMCWMTASDWTSLSCGSGLDLYLEVLGYFPWHLAPTNYRVWSPLCLNRAAWFLQIALREISVTITIDHVS